MTHDIKERVKELTPGVDPERRQTEFIKILRGYMHERGIETPNELWRQLKDYGKRGDPKGPSRATVQGYFKPLKPGEEPKPPGRWFVRACMDLLKLDKKKCCDLCRAYFDCYD